MSTAATDAVKSPSRPNHEAAPAALATVTVTAASRIAHQPGIQGLFSRVFPRGVRDPPCLLDKLRQAVAEKPDAVIYRWLDARGREVKTITFEGLWRRSGAIATKLCGPKVGLRQGDLAMIVFPIGIDFMPALVACFRAGIVAVSTYPPDLRRPATELPKFAGFVRDCGARVAITTPGFKKALTAVRVAGYTLPAGIDQWVACNPAHSVDGELDIDVVPAPDDAAFIQYTSGSSGSPKGVVVTHRCMRYSVGAIRVASNAPRRGVGWLPQYHDYGLVGAFLAALGDGGELTVMSPITFIKRPELWLEAMEKYRATVTAAPTFAYCLAAKRAKASGRIYDLSSLQQADIAAEPITAEALQAMVDLGIPPTARLASYGLAEAVLWVTSTRNVGLDAATGCPRTGNQALAQSLGSFIVVADPETRTVVPDGTSGRVYVHSPGITPGYFNKPKITAQRFGLKLLGTEGIEGLPKDATWYDTMDIGYLRDGELHVSGRASDVIIIGGRNIFPQDIERRAEALLSTVIRPGCSVAIQHTSSEAALLLEARKPTPVIDDAELRRLQLALQEELSVPIGVIMVFRKSTLPKTTSGKVRRRECGRRFRTHSLPKPLCSLGHTGTATSFAQLVEHLGITDPSLSLAENGVDSMQLAEFLGAASSDFGVTLDVSAIMQMSVKELLRRHRADVTCATPGASDAASEPASGAGAGAGAGAEAATAAVAGTAIVTTSLEDAPDESPVPEVDSSALVDVDCGSPALLNVDCGSPWSSAKEGRRKDSGVVTPHFSAGLIAVLQLAAYLLLGLAMAACVVPADWVAKWLSDHVTTGLQRDAVRLLPPIVWMVCFTLWVVLMKWVLMAGRIQPGHLPTWSPFYFRWWFLDRIMGLWEALVGHLLLDTPWLCIVYKAMGCPKCPPLSVRLHSFIREPELFSAGAGADIRGSVLCRELSPAGVAFGRMWVRANTIVRQGVVMYPGAQHQDGLTERRSSGATLADDAHLRNHYILRLLWPGLLAACVAASTCLAGAAARGLMGDSAPLGLHLGLALLILTLATGLLARTTVIDYVSDRLGAVCSNLLAPWVDYSPMAPLVLRLFGARLGVGVVVNHASAVAPSKADAIIVGTGSNLSSSVLLPEAGRGIYIGKRVMLGTGAVINAGVTVGDGGAVIAAANIPAGSHIEQNRAFLAAGLSVSSRSLRTTHGPGACSLFFTEVATAAVRIVLQWVPTLAFGYGLAVLVGSLVEVLADAGCPHALTVMTAAYVVLVLCVLGVSLVFVINERLSAGEGQTVAMNSFAAMAIECRLGFSVSTWTRIVGPALAGSWIDEVIRWAAGQRLEGRWMTHMILGSLSHRTTMGEGVIVDRGAKVLGHTMNVGEIYFAATRVGSGCVIRSGAIMAAGHSLGPGITLAPRSRMFGVTKVPKLPAGSVLSGSPAAATPRSAAVASPRSLRGCGPPRDASALGRRLESMSVGSTGSPRGDGVGLTVAGTVNPMASMVRGPEAV